MFISLAIPTASDFALWQMVVEFSVTSYPPVVFSFCNGDLVLHIFDDQWFIPLALVHLPSQDLSNFF
jgi:hypothetical protein